MDGHQALKEVLMSKRAKKRRMKWKGKAWISKNNNKRYEMRLKQKTLLIGHFYCRPSSKRNLALSTAFPFQLTPDIEFFFDHKLSFNEWLIISTLTLHSPKNHCFRKFIQQSSFILLTPFPSVKLGKGNVLFHNLSLKKKRLKTTTKTKATYNASISFDTLQLPCKKVLFKVERKLFHFSIFTMLCHDNYSLNIAFLEKL